MLRHPNEFRAMISIVMASYLGPYHGAASDRETKIRRAIDSVLSQSVKDWELVIVADGCEKTLAIVREYTDARIRLVDIEKQPLWSPTVRNVGQYTAKGEWVTYLDADDYLGPNHLKKMNIPDGHWGFFNIHEWRGGAGISVDKANLSGGFVEVICRPTHRHNCGTGNLIHRKGLYWPDEANDYKHDWTFIEYLRKVGAGTKLPTTEYYVCHIPQGPYKCDI